LISLTSATVEPWRYAGDVSHRIIAAAGDPKLLDPPLITGHVSNAPNR
jgi:hypothetical protein